MTMNPHTSASDLRREATAAKHNAAARENTLHRIVSPAALASAAFIIAVSLIAKVFYK